jgi:hypothetical protein
VFPESLFSSSSSSSSYRERERPPAQFFFSAFRYRSVIERRRRKVAAAAAAAALSLCSSVEKGGSGELGGKGKRSRDKVVPGRRQKAKVYRIERQYFVLICPQRKSHSLPIKCCLKI